MKIEEVAKRFISGKDGKSSRSPTAGTAYVTSSRGGYWSYRTEVARRLSCTQVAVSTAEYSHSSNNHIKAVTDELFATGYRWTDETVTIEVYAPGYPNRWKKTVFIVWTDAWAEAEGH